MVPLIELRGVTITKNDYDVLANVSLRVQRGRSTVIVGPSGSGKSMLLKVAGGIMPPDAGQVLFEGDDLARLPEQHMLAHRRHYGFAFEDSALWQNKSIFENLALPLQVHSPDLPYPLLEQRVFELLGTFGLERTSALRPAELSGGEQKGVSFLRALLLEPYALLMDEPVLGLDHVLAQRMTDRIRSLKQSGCTMVAVTHDAGLTSLIADDLVVLRNGAVVASGPFDEVKTTRDPAVVEILEHVLGEIMSYDNELLEMLGGDPARPDRAKS